MAAGNDICHCSVKHMKAVGQTKTVETHIFSCTYASKEKHHSSVELCWANMKETCYTSGRRLRE